MCGIIGILNASTNGLFKEDATTFLHMASLNAFRGMQSTGFYGVSKDNQIDYIKGKGHPFDLTVYEGGDQFLNRIVSAHEAVIGHGRLATMGKITAQNAHPFIYPDSITVHNGNIRNIDELIRLFANTEEEKKDWKDTEVDSEVAAKVFNKVGFMEAIKKISGAYSFIVYDKKNKMFHISRNTERPLHFLDRKDRKQILIASEREVLEWVKMRFRMTGEIRIFESHKDYQIPLSSSEMTVVDYWQQTWSGGYGNRKGGYHPYQEYENEWSAMDDGPHYNVTAPPRSETSAALLTDRKRFPTTNYLKIRLGDRITFYPTMHTDYVAADSGNMMFVAGNMTGHGNVAVSASEEASSVKGLDFKLSDVYSGEVFKIERIFNKDTNTFMRLFVHSIKLEKSNSAIVPFKSDNLVKLKDETEWGKLFAEKIAGFGCYQCNSAIGMHQLSECTSIRLPHFANGGSNARLLCPACTTANELLKKAANDDTQ